MSIEIIRYNREYETRWDLFVDTSINGTFLHKRSFYNSNPQNKVDDHSYLFIKKNKIICLISGCLVESDNKITFHSHLRATYGGFIFSDKVGTVESLKIVELLLAELKSKGCQRVIIRNPFRFLYKELSDEFEYALWFNNFTIQSRELEIAIPLKTKSQSSLKKYENGTKYNVKKAWKFVNVKESNLSEIEVFWKILTENLLRKHNKKPTHDLSQIKNLIKQCGSENFKLFSAYYDKKLVAGCFIFIINNNLHAQYIGQDETFQEFRPLNAVIDYIINWGFDNNYRYFNLGTANEGGKVINEGLFHFKESFGGRGVLRETHELIL